MGRRRNRVRVEPIFPKQVRKEKADQVKNKLQDLGFPNQQKEIKKLLVILDLWVNFNREHQELLELPFIKNKKLEIQLYDTNLKVSRITLKHI